MIPRASTPGGSGDPRPVGVTVTYDPGAYAVGRTSTRVTFPSYTARTKRKGSCPTCGRQTVRSRSFESTVNPWNRVDDPSVPSGKRQRTDREVRAYAVAKATAWEPGPDEFEHAKCREARP